MDKKKRLCVIMCVIIICMVCWCLYHQHKKNFREFSVFRSFVVTSKDYKETTIEVIVNLKKYDIDEMFDKVVEFQNWLNGESDELTVRLYNSKKDLLNDNLIEERVFYKESE